MSVRPPLAHSNVYGLATVCILSQVHRYNLFLFVFLETKVITRVDGDGVEKNKKPRRLAHFAFFVCSAYRKLHPSLVVYYGAALPLMSVALEIEDKEEEPR